MEGVTQLYMSLSTIHISFLMWWDPLFYALWYKLIKLKHNDGVSCEIEEPNLYVLFFFFFLFSFCIFVIFLYYISCFIVSNTNICIWYHVILLDGVKSTHGVHVIAKWNRENKNKLNWNFYFSLWGKDWR